MKSTLYRQYTGPRVPNFYLLYSAISSFQHIVHFTMFTLTLVLRFQGAAKVLVLGRSPKIYNLYVTIRLPYLLCKVWLR